jgi:hypothetical protein
MAKFIQGDELNLEIQRIIGDATEFLMLISPYIKLHPRLRDSLKSKIKNDRLEIVLVFGKNENDYYKSMPKEEFDFFTQFPNIEIRHEERLHAKFYANEHASVLTSMNLYDFSQNHNIEAGIYLDTKFINRLSSYLSLDEQALQYFEEVIENSKLLFKRKPQYSNTFIPLRKKYEGSIITENLIENIVEGKKEKIKENIEPKSSLEGFCIRCGTTIKLNTQKPYCDKCYDSWQKYKNEKYTEKLCHICGVDSKTSMIKPTCYNCYKSHKNKLDFKVN